jgi:predicted Zn-dependent peptidase
MISYFTTQTGVRGIHMKTPAAAVAYAGVVVGAGTRDEDSSRGEDGLAHFVEHTIFKGTVKRSSWHIINRMERVGGELNAFTSKDDTVIYTIFPRRHADRAIELVIDLIANSQFPASELDKEREVVADEIDSYLDSPSDAVFDDFEDLLFKGTSLGHNILGTRQTLRGFDSAVCRDWLDRNYISSRLMFFYCGAESVDAVVRKIEKYESSIRRSDEPMSRQLIDVSSLGFADTVKKVATHQAHTVMGSAIDVRDSRQRLRLALLSNILGGPGMNSLLNVELRERRGLVYNVEASVSSFGECGEFTIYFGCDNEDNDLCVRLVKEQLEKMAEARLSQRQLQAAKKQYLGQLIVSRENRENQIISAARAALSRGRAMTAQEVSEIINSITADELADTARLIATPSILTFANHS